MKPRNATLLTAINNFLKRNDLSKVTLILNRIHPADAAEIIEALPEEQRTLVFTEWNPEHSAEALLEMDEVDQVEVAEHLKPETISNILEAMPADDATDLLGDLEPESSEMILGFMKPKAAAKIRQLLIHEKNTAGGIMNPSFVSLKKKETAKRALEELREAAREVEAINNLFVVNEEKQLVGSLSIRNLIVSEPKVLVRDIMDTDLVYVDVSTDQEEVAKIMAKYDLIDLPVVDEEHKLLGIITIDDVVDVIEDEATEDMYRLSGTTEYESDVMETSIFNATRSRFPWILLALVGEVILVGFIASRYTFLIRAVPALAIYWAAMTSIGGNTSFQAATVAVRSLATGDFEVGMIWKRGLREFLLGLVISSISAVILFVIALFWQGALDLAIIVAIANVAIILAGALTGAFVPVLFYKMGIDPAVSSNPLLALIMDATSLLLYFSIALFIYRWLNPAIFK